MSVRRFDLEAGGDDFSFLPETEPKIAFWLSKYPEERKRSAVIPLLWLAQKDNAGWLSEPAMREVAERLDMPYIRVYEVATFYTMFRLQPVGQYHIQLCGTTPCMLRGANSLKDVCQRLIGKSHSVNDSRRLSWEEVECLGACVNAPVVQVNDYYYEDLSAESFEELLRKLEAGVFVEPGTFVDRWKSAPAGGKITLTDASLYDGSVPKHIGTLPNAPAELPQTALQPRNSAGVAVPLAAAEAADDVALMATTLAPEEFKKPEAVEAPVAGSADDLKRINGIGPVLEEKLNSLGIFFFHQIAAWGAAEVAWIDDYLSFKGRVLREKWVPQAKVLAGEGEA